MARQQTDYSPSEAGLPGSEEYQPETIGSADISAGEPTESFPEYGLELVPIMHNGDDTGRRFVRRNGVMLSDVSDRYNLFPNERTVEVANNVAREVGAEPFHEWGDDDADWYCKLEDHVYQDEQRRRVHALYAFPQQVEVADGDPINVGFAVHDSIDASMSFQIGLFTYRHACANMVTMSVKNVSADEFIHDQRRGFSAFDVEDEREVINHDANYHTTGFEVDPESLEVRIKQVVLAANDVIEGYQGWAEEVITPDIAAELLNRATGSGNLTAVDLPDWFASIANDFEAIEANESLDERDEAERKQDVIEAGIPDDETVWETYNDVTESVWHSDTTNDSTKQRKFKDLHRVLSPAPTVK